MIALCDVRGVMRVVWWWRGVRGVIVFVSVIVAWLMVDRALPPQPDACCGGTSTIVMVHHPSLFSSSTYTFSHQALASFRVDSFMHAYVGVFMNAWVCACIRAYVHAYVGVCVGR